MTKYCTNGSASLDALMDRHMEQIADEVWTSSYSRHWKALILSGGYGRGQGTALTQKDGSQQPFDDYELVVVTSRDNTLIKGALAHLEKRLTAELGLPVHLRPCLKSRLPKCEFSLPNYELKYGHRVIRGDETILKKLPEYPHDSIPLTAGTRLLMNCGKLLLDIKTHAARNRQPTDQERTLFAKHIVKTTLALGDCALLMRNEYDLSSAVKKERIQTLDLNGVDNPRGFINAYITAIDFTQSGAVRYYENANLHLWLSETVQRYLDVFLWYERRTLNRKFRDLKKYAQTFPHLGNEGSPLENIRLNMNAFGLRAVPHMTIHPRMRLYPAVALLLDDTADSTLIQKLLASPNATYSELCDDFRALHQQFS